MTKARKISVSLTPDEVTLIREALKTHAVKLHEQCRENRTRKAVFQVSDKIMGFWHDAAVKADQMAIDLESAK